MALKINIASRSNPDTGFGVQASQIGGRFLNKDGSFNLKKEGPLRHTTSIYSLFMELSWLRFLGAILACYLCANLTFTGMYLLVGLDQLQGFVGSSTAEKIREVFYFSTQTFTTVGYGRINPVRDGADVIASLETFCGWLFFALVTGLLYGRFTRPKAYIAFSEHALISPYKEGIALMFRMVPYKKLHHLTDAKVAVNLALTVMENEKPEFKFYQLALERTRVDIFNMNWTVVHPIGAESPLLNVTEQDIAQSDLELIIQVTGFDPLFSNMVMARTSYTYKEIVWGARFRSMFHESADGNSTILELNKLDQFDRVELKSVKKL